MTDPPNASPPPVLAVGAVVVVDAQLLLVTRSNPPAQGLWTLPGGRVEHGERLADAVVREVVEETGLDVTCGRLIGWVERIGAGFHFVIFDFEAVPTGSGVHGGTTDLNLTAGDDAGEARWIPLDHVAAMDLVPGLLDFLTYHDVLTPAT